MTEDNDPVIDTFVGSFFHSDGTDGGWQGKVLEALGDKGTYCYVLTFSWLHGFEATRHIVSIHDMTKWTFYSCAENIVELDEPHTPTPAAETAPRLDLSVWEALG